MFSDYTVCVLIFPDAGNRLVTIDEKWQTRVLADQWLMGEMAPRRGRVHLKPHATDIAEFNVTATGS